MSHTHTMPDGTETGTEIVDPANGDLHWHEVDGVRTEGSEPFGPNHTHTLDGAQSSKPNEKGGVDEMEVKSFSGCVIECKEEERNGQPVGIVEGYIATWDLDRGNDRFLRGAFTESLAELKRQQRPIRLKDHHFRTVGGFPIDSVKEDERGLFGVGEINLNVQQGREAFALAKQGILSDFSIGFSPTEWKFDEDVRIIEKAIVWEGSIVDEPMNPAAKVTEVKSVVPFQDLPLADRDRAWDSSAAMGRVREFTGSEDEPSSSYRRAFLWYDRENASEFGAYKLPIADVVNGRLVAVPRGIFAAAAAMQGARGGVDIPDGDRPGVIRHLERYYAKMDLDSPFEDDDKSFDIEITPRNIEQALKTWGFSKSESKTLASQLKLDNGEDDTQTKRLQVVQALKNLVNEMQNAA